MMGLLRKFRALIGNGVVWAVAWMFGSVLFTIVPALLGGIGLPTGVIGAILANSALFGFLSGSVFSVVLGIAYRNRLLGDIRPASMGVLGAVAGMAIPMGLMAIAASAGNPIPMFAVVPFLLTSGGLGCATSVGSLRLAKVAEPDALAEDVGLT